MKMSTYYYHRESDFSDFIKFEFSKSFMKELKKQVSHILKKAIGEVLDLQDLYISIHSLPSHDSIKRESNIAIGIHYYSCHGIYCTLHWHDTEGKQLFNYTDEFPPNRILFKIEDLDVEYFKRDLIKNAHLRGKKVLTDYRFVVELKKIDVDVYFKILYTIPITEDLANSLETTVGEYIASYNEQSQKKIEGFTGLIHSFSLHEYKKKDSITFKIDLGSGVDIGLKYLFQQFSESEFEIRKIEVKGV
jgi:hypothetical protein